MRRTDSPVWITGAGGQLGTAFRLQLPDAVALSRSALDIADVESVREMVLANRPSMIINCAAFTAVDRAEDDESLASRVNGEAVGVLAATAAEIGARFVTYSTDYVFDGRGRRPYVESDPTRPINAYGRSKLQGETLALEVNPDSLVVRTSWVVSGTHDNFVSTMLRLAGDGRALRVVDDQIGNPTIVGDLARYTRDLLSLEATGIVHVTNQGSTSWYELARRVVELAGLDVNLLTPCSTDEYPTPAARPAYSVLGSERRSKLGIEELPRWQDALVQVVDEQLQRPGSA